MSLNTDIQKIRKSFPILKQEMNDRPLVYLDNAATTHKPRVVIDAISEYYNNYNSNVHRGVHTLSQKATEAFENSREKVRETINAASAHEIIFTSGATEAINMIAFSYGEKYIGEGDEIIISGLEHHSNIVPWQLVAERKNAHIKVLPVNEKGELILEKLDTLITKKTRIIAVNHISNTLGTINPVKEIIKKAHNHDIPVLVDGAQGIPHLDVDVQDLDVDFYCFSGHKVYGPTGVGVAYGKEKWLSDIPPYKGGGEMINRVTFEKTTYNDLPYKFEAGTPNIAGVIGLHKALEFVESTGKEKIRQIERELLDYATSQLKQIEGLKIYGEATNKTSVISFLINDIHPYDAGTIFDKLGIAIRTGHHCTQPLMDHFKIPGTVRASFAPYNTKKEIDILVEAIKKVKTMFG
ncbi:MAG: cysteine desulfurase [Bacteroidales bacterium]|nr:cysteine desulfurase [Bacteroidales bacterium]MCF8327716.1 cysteine desulfurase [Bacteroidales bacterium]